VLLRKDGGEVPGLVSARPLFREEEYMGTLATFTDLTGRKEMEQQLIQAGKLAAIGQLVAGVAHELNNPLTSVVGYSELLMGADCSEGIKRDLEKINRQGVRAARIVENLLTFARRREPRKESININEVIERSLELQAHQLELNRISIVRELDEALPPIVADPFQMQQVFMNIISNAHQVLRDWGGERRLRVRSELAGDMIHLEFADSGPGIPAEVMRRLFEPFFTTREVGEGTGLGLSIAHGIVEAHGGSIWAESEVGKGTTFRVRLPISVG
jgi:signal transduction histidine kinase